MCALLLVWSFGRRRNAAAAEAVHRQRHTVMIPFHVLGAGAADRTIEDSRCARIHDLHLRMNVHREVGVHVQPHLDALLAKLIGSLAHLDANGERERLKVVV